MILLFTLVFWAIIALNIGLSGVLLVQTRQMVRLNQVLMDICLRAWALRAFPELLRQAVSLKIESVEIEERRHGRTPPNPPRR